MESIAMEMHEMQPLNGLSLTPLEVIIIADPADNPFKMGIKQELTPQCEENTDKDRGRCLIFEESNGELDINRERVKSVESNEYNSLVEGADINVETEDAVVIETKDLTSLGYIIQEKSEVIKTHRRRCIGYLKFEDSDDEDVRNELTVKENTRYGGPLSSQSKEAMNTDRRRSVDYVKLKDTEHGKDIEKVVLIDVEGNKNDRFTDEEEIPHDVIVVTDSESIEAEEEIDIVSVESPMQSVTPSTYVRTDYLPQTAYDGQKFQRNVECATRLRRAPYPNNDRVVSSPTVGYNPTRRRRTVPVRRVTRRRIDTDSDTEGPNLERRSILNDIERHRRSSIRNLFEELRILIPATKGKKRASKVEILGEATSLCRQLHEEDIRRDLLEKEQSELIAKLRRLLEASRMTMGGTS